MIYIVQDKEVARFFWSKMTIGLQGEIIVELVDPFSRELEQMEEIAERSEPRREPNLFVMKDSDYMLAFHNLVKARIDVWVHENELGRILIHRLTSMKLAERYYGEL